MKLSLETLGGLPDTVRGRRGLESGPCYRDRRGRGARAPGPLAPQLAWPSVCSHGFESHSHGITGAAGACCFVCFVHTVVGRGCVIVHHHLVFLHVKMPLILLKIIAPIDGYLGHFQFGAVQRVDMDVFVHVFSWT